MAKVALAFALASLSFNTIERYFMRMKNRLARTSPEVPAQPSTLSKAA